MRVVYKIQDLARRSIHSLLSPPNLQISTVFNMPSKFAYLVISPSPIKGNYVHSKGGVSVDNKGSEKVVFDQVQVNYIKIGHQDELADRVSAYNTHNPSSKGALL